MLSHLWSTWPENTRTEPGISLQMQYVNECRSVDPTLKSHAITSRKAKSLSWALLLDSFFPELTHSAGLYGVHNLPSVRLCHVSAAEAHQMDRLLHSLTNAAPRSIGDNLGFSIFSMGTKKTNQTDRKVLIEQQYNYGLIINGASSWPNT